MFFELFLGLRYLKAKRKQTFISVITIISVAGIMVGVMALIVVLSVMNGFRADLLAKILGVNPHIMVMSHSGALKDYQKVAEHPEQNLRELALVNLGRCYENIGAYAKALEYYNKMETEYPQSRLLSEIKDKAAFLKGKIPSENSDLSEEKQG